jgi:hypothetical protein
MDSEQSTKRSRGRPKGSKNKPGHKAGRPTGSQKPKHESEWYSLYTAGASNPSFTESNDMSNANANDIDIASTSNGK